ncbi:MAG: methylglyoxal synthase [Bacteriovoracaceae bacterium]|nr:methylglyoxal synthase [Bacteriovoracaceae bacterium]
MKKAKKTIALIAHDGKKAELIAFVKDNKSFFQRYNLIATSTTGKHVQLTGLKVKRYLSGPLGGDAQIAALVATGKCQAVIFMRDPLGMHPHEPDIYTLLRICDVHNVPLATNPATAQMVVENCP